MRPHSTAKPRLALLLPWLSLGLLLFVVLHIFDLRSTLHPQLLAAQQSGGSSLAGAAGQRSASGSKWQAAALASISAYRHGLLKAMVPLFDSQINGTTGFTMQDWQLFEPIITCPPDRPLTRYGGEDDGAKLLCDVGHGRLGKGCVIYSMGSAGNIKFEEAMLAATPCEIHTFDCTVDGASIHGRHHYHKWCIGSGADPRLKPWAAVTSELGHSRVDLLKIDIEGHEYPVLADLQPGLVLPAEISIEIHVRMSAQWKTTHLQGSWQNGLDLPHTPASLALVFSHLAGLGYGTYSQDINKDWFMCCSEFSLLRVEAEPQEQRQFPLRRLLQHRPGIS